MAYNPISGSVPQFSRNAGGASANGYYLKFYQAGTTTPLSMGVDATPSSTLAKCALNSRGEPISNEADETTVFIPHLNADYKIVLYANATDADNNTTANALWVVDNLSFDQNVTVNGVTVALDTYLENLEVDSYADLRNLTVSQLSDGSSVRVTNSGIAGTFILRNSVAHGLSDNGGTIIVIDSDWYAERVYDSASLNALWFGLSTSETAANNKTAMDNIIAAAFAFRKSVFIPHGQYEINPFTIVPNGTQRTFHMYGDFAPRAGEVIPTSADSIAQFGAIFYFPNITGTDIAIEVGESGGTGELHNPILERIYLLGPNLEAGTPTTNSTGLRITDGARDMIIRDVHIAQFRVGLITNDVFVFTIENSKIARCQVGAIWGAVSNRITAYDLKITDCTYGAFHTGSGSVTYIEPWFEGQPATNAREMVHAVVVGGSSSSPTDAIKDITFIGGWYEQIQEEFIAVGWYDDGTGAGGGATPNLVNSVAVIDRINIVGYGHWDSIGQTTSGTKVKVNASASNIEDNAVRIYSDLGQFDFSQVVGDATKVKSGNNFESHAANGYPISRWVTEKDDGAAGGTNAGLKTSIPDNTATTFINFAVPNSTIVAVFRITYAIITNTERSISCGEVLVRLGRTSGLATQGGVDTVNDGITNISSTESNSATTFALTGLQAKDTADTTTETIGLQVTQDNTNSASATISYTVEQVCGTRQAGVGSNYISISQA